MWIPNSIYAQIYRSLKRSFFVVCSLIFFLSHSSNAFSEPTRDAISPHQKLDDLRRENWFSHLLKEYWIPVYHVEILSSTAAGTEANPPSSKVRVTETLRGRALDTEQTVVWSDGATKTQHDDPTCNRAQGFCSYSVSESWLTQKVYPPRIGSQVFLVQVRPLIPSTHTRPSYNTKLVGLSNEPSTLLTSFATVATPELLQFFKANATKEKPILKRLESTLFWLAFLTPFAALCFSNSNKWFALALSVGSCVFFGLYMFARSYYDISLDLPLLYLSMFVAIAVAGGSVQRIMTEKMQIESPDSTAQ